MSNNNKTPEIRFKGFTDAWEQRKLGDIGETYTGLSGKTKEDFGHGDAKFVTYMNVFSNSIADSAMTESVEIDKKQNEVKYGDVFFTTSSETPDEVGMSSVWLENSENTYLNSFCFGYRPNENINPYYMAYMLRSENVRKSIIFLAQGISRYNISKNKMMEISVPLPNLDEQQKIGDYFRNLDNLITLHQRKLEKLKNVRESMLQKMFPQNGSNKPEIRFKGFTAAWEQRKLSEISECLDSMRIPLNANERSKMQGSIPYYGAGRIQDYINQYLFDEELVLLLEDGDAFDDFKTKSIAQYICGKSWVNNHAHILRPKGDAFFLFISLAHKDIRNVTQLAGASRKKLVKDAMLRIAIDVPSIAEQTKIGAFFKELDGLITLHQRQCDKYKSIKAGLIRKLFPME